MTNLAKDSLPQLRGQLEDELKTHRDFITDLGNLHMAPEGIYLKNASQVRPVNGPTPGTDYPLIPTAWGEAALLSWLGMPARYFKKLKEHGVEHLYQQHFEYWTRQHAGKELYFRALQQDDYLTLRGVLSQKYVTVNDATLVALLENLLPPDALIEKSARDLHRLVLRITWEGDRQGAYIPTGQADSARLGFDLINSEVGCASMIFTGLIWRLVCSNGLRTMAPYASWKRRHIGGIDEDEVKRALQEVWEGGNRFFDNWVNLAQIPLAHPEQAINSVAKHLEFPKHLRDNAMEEYEQGLDRAYDQTAYAVVNAYTRVVREYATDQRLDFEARLGKLAETTEEQWRLWQGQEN